jgi:uncharacterized protein with GYD domain
MLKTRGGVTGPGGTTMPKFMLKFSYSSASWARMLAVTDDRTSAVSALMEHLGGKLECMYWEVEDAASYVICDLPDALSAAAAVTAATRTGAFKSVTVRQLLSQDQVRDVVVLAKSSEGIYHAPGAAAVESSLGRYGRAATSSSTGLRRPVKNGISTLVCRRARAPRRWRMRSTMRCSSSASKASIHS